MNQILLVEDDPQIREIIQDYFSEKGEGIIKLTCAKDGEEGLQYMSEQAFDLLLLDIMLPGVDGYTLCREYRKREIAPVIFITARGREDDILLGYELGCDDYIVKPFSLAVLFAKVNALLKRDKGMVKTEVMQVGEITLNPYTYEVKAKGCYIELAPKEYALLRLFFEKRGMVISRDELLTKIWGYDFEGNERVVDNHIKKLRKALGTSGKQIKTVISKGYQLEE